MAPNGPPVSTIFDRQSAVGKPLNGRWLDSCRHLREDNAVQVPRVECALGASTLILETGKLAKQADGAVVSRLGDTMVLTAATEGNVREGIDFFPLQVEYRERTSAAGKFPGGYIKRETRPSTKETLTSRLIDRPVRPLFPADYVNEVQIMATVYSADKEND